MELHCHIVGIVDVKFDDLSGRLVACRVENVYTVI